MSLLTWHDIWVLLLIIISIDAVLFGAIAIGHTSLVQRLRRFLSTDRPRPIDYHCNVALSSSSDKLVIVTERMAKEVEAYHEFSRALEMAHTSINGLHQSFVRMREAMLGALLLRRLHRFGSPHFNDCTCNRCLHSAYWRTITGE
jgi:hypothetical protein